MRLSEALRLECIAINVELSDKMDALRMVSRMATKCDALRGIDENEVLNALLEREKLGTTGFGKGIAIPHCRIEGIEEFVIGIILVPDGVEFDAIDGEKVKIIAFIIGPLMESNEHIRLLSRLSYVLNIPGTVDEILQAGAPKIVRESLLRHIVKDESPKKGEKCSLFYVFIQDDKLFRQILGVFSAMESSSIAVIEAKNAREFLMKTPLFAGFWRDEMLFSCKLILATVDRRLTNNTIRQIEDIAGILDKQDNLMVVVQEIYYTGGKISV